MSVNGTRSPQSRRLLHVHVLVQGRTCMCIVSGKILVIESAVWNAIASHISLPQR